MKLKLGQKKKVPNFFQLHQFLNTFLQLAAEKKYSKNGAAGNFFGPSYFVMALPCSSEICSFDNVTFDTYQNINGQKFSNILINPKESFVSSGTRGVS